MAFVEDMTPFFNVNEFATAAQFTPAAGGVAQAGVVIYDENGVVLDDFGVETVGPSVQIPASQWPNCDEADLLQINFPAPLGARTYRIRAKTLLGDGKIALLSLVRA